MMKFGNVCHVATLPSNVFPEDMALSVQEIAAGNEVTTDDDEEEIHEMLLEQLPLSASEQNNLHPEIKSLCSGSPFKTFKASSISKGQGEDLKSGKIIFHESNPSTGNCELQVFKFNIFYNPRLDIVFHIYFPVL
jgi:hypothetical protein